MAKFRGRNVPISAHRRLVTDLMHFSRKVPCVCVDRRINISSLVAARARLSPRPAWTAIFMKAFGIVAARTPELRRAYMTFPWPRIYEHARNNAAFNVVRKDGDENVIVQGHIRQPENRALAELDAIIRHHKLTPLAELPDHYRARKLASLPWVIRWLVWWVGLNWFGRRRAHNFGTFCVTSIADHGAGTQHLVALLTATLHYSLLDDDGNIELRLTFDHRVLDGVAAADALVCLEEVLLTEILPELAGSTPLARAA
jgi:hypothetical protein